jgi:hypothetical protein
MAFEVSSVPLSLTIVSGRRRRRRMMWSSSRATRRPEIEVSATSQAFSGAVVDHRQDTEAPTVGQLVGDEVQAPALVGPYRRRDRPPGSHRPLAAAAPAHGQPLLAVEALDPLLVDGMAFTPQQHVQATVAEPPSLLGQGFQPLAQCRIVRSRGLIAHARPVGPDHPAGPPLAHLEGLT